MESLWLGLPSFMDIKDFVLVHTDKKGAEDKVLMELSQAGFTSVE